MLLHATSYTNTTRSPAFQNASSGVSAVKESRKGEKKESQTQNGIIKCSWGSYTNSEMFISASD